jgi:hypothetical protein
MSERCAYPVGWLVVTGFFGAHHKNIAFRRVTSPAKELGARFSPCILRTAGASYLRLAGLFNPGPCFIVQVKTQVLVTPGDVKDSFELTDHEGFKCSFVVWI